MDTKTQPAIRTAADLVGVPAIAASCSVSLQAVYKWLTNGHAPADRCPSIEQATGGKVSRLDLLADSLDWVSQESGARKRRTTDSGPTSTT